MSTLFEENLDKLGEGTLTSDEANDARLSPAERQALLDGMADRAAT